MNETNRPPSLGQRIAAWVGLSPASSTRAGSGGTRATGPRVASTGFPEPVGPAPRHNDPELVIPTIEAELQPLARELLGAGFAVIEAWGPVQMACAGLLLERDGTQVLFDAERGMTSAHLIRDGRNIWLGAAVAAWARSSNGDGEPNVPGFTPWSLISLFTWEQRENRKAGAQQETRLRTGRVRLVRQRRSRGDRCRRSRAACTRRVEPIHRETDSRGDGRGGRRPVRRCPRSVLRGSRPRSAVGPLRRLRKGARSCRCVR